MNDPFDLIADKTALLNAWQYVKAKGKAGGIDSVSIEKFDLQVGNYVDLLHQQLQENVYVPEPYKTFSIPKNENEFRKLGLPTVKDKVVQLATKHVLEPLFEKQFLGINYGYRPGRGPVKAINRVRHRIVSEGRSWVTLADIDNFFDTINPEILYSLIEKSINSPRLMRLIKLWVQIGSLNYRAKYEPYTEGIPQGCILSPLFSNIYLNGFDKFMVEKGYGMVRYADDFVILSHTDKEAFKAYNDSKNFLETELKLTLNKDWKVKKANNGFEFLHITFRGKNIELSQERLYKLYEKIDQSIIVVDGNPDSKKLQQTLNGIGAYYGKLLPQPILETLDNALCDSVAKKMAQCIVRKEILRKQLIDNYLLDIQFFSNEYKKNKASKSAEIKQKIALFSKKSEPPKPEKSIEKAIEKKREQYEELANNNREIVISTPGTQVGKNYKGITIKIYGVQNQIIQTNALTNITILTNGVSLSGNVIAWCAKNNVPIDLIGFDGHPIAKITAPDYPDAEMSLAQTQAIENGKAQKLIRKFIEGKIKNQIGLVKYYYKYRKERDADYAEVYTQRIEQMENMLQKIKTTHADSLSSLRDSVMGFEGHASVCYWDMVVRLLNDYTTFEGRERQGATDLVNSMLNYGYGILYSRVWHAITKKHLNPCISYLHTPQNGKPTLAFDVIEEFRQQAVDKVVFALITKGEDMRVSNGLLTPDTKNRLVEKVLERLNNREKFRGKTMRLSDIIDSQVDLMVQFINGKQNYKPYVAKW